MNRAVFLDRDGVINEILYFPELGIMDTPFAPEQFRLLPDVAEAIALINRMNLKAIVVSNQPGVAKNHFTEEILARIDRKMKAELAADGAHLDGVYYCLHHPQAVVQRYKVVCDCRKPRPGLLLKAARDANIDLASSFMIGDSLTDVEAGHQVGCRTFLIGRMKCELCRQMDVAEVSPDFIVGDLLEAVKIIQKERSNGNLH